MILIVGVNGAHMKLTNVNVHDNFVFGKTVGSGEAQRYEIIAALDLLFTGI